MLPEAKDALIQAGCKVKEYLTYSIVKFPTGTTRVEIRPRTFQTRYKLTLPDGRVIMERYCRYKEKSLLFLPVEMVAKELQTEAGGADIL